MYPIRPNRQRAKQIINIFYIVIAFSFVNLALVTWQYFLYKGFQDNPDNIDISLAQLSDNLDMVSGILNLGLHVVTIVYFIRWFRRAYYNLHAIHSSEVSQSEGWAAGAWFVPFMNLVRPYQIMREIWTGTQRALPHKYPDVAPVGLLGVWWTLYLIMSISSNISARLAMSVSTVDDLTGVAISSLIAEIVSIPAAFLTVQVIKKVSSFEDELWEEALNPSDSVFAVTPAVVAPPDVPPAAPAS
jgi:hypothetical protein